MPTLFHTITDREAIVWSKMLQNSEDPEQFLEDVQFIDQALTLCKNKALLNKKRGLKKDLHLLIAKACGIENPVKHVKDFEAIKW